MADLVWEEDPWEEDHLVLRLSWLERQHLLTRNRESRGVWVAWSDVESVTVVDDTWRMVWEWTGDRRRSFVVWGVFESGPASIFFIVYRATPRGLLVRLRDGAVDSSAWLIGKRRPEATLERLGLPILHDDR